MNQTLCTPHIANPRGLDPHHQIESLFKAIARALRAALDRDGYVLLGAFERNRVQLGRRDHAPFGPADVATACGAVGAVMDAGLRRR